MGGKWKRKHHAWVYAERSSISSSTAVGNSSHALAELGEGVWQEMP